MKKHLLRFCLLCLLFCPDAARSEERIHHYEGKTITSPEQAVKTLNDENTAIKKILEENEVLSDSNLEIIHEISYTLENAIDYLKENKHADQPVMNAIDESIQAVHSSSENHNEEQTRAWQMKLELAIASLTNPAAQDKTKKDPATDKNEITLKIKNHLFSPASLTIPAGKKIKLIVINEDPTPEEFESYELNREKIIPGGGKAIIFIGPLEPGTYPFFGEFNMDTAKGEIIAE